MKSVLNLLKKSSWEQGKKLFGDLIFSQLLGYTTVVKLKEVHLDSTIGQFAFLRTILIRHQKLLILQLCTIVIGSLLSAVVPYFTKLQIDQLEQSGQTILTPLAIFAVLLLIPFILELLRTFGIDRAQNLVSNRLYTQVRISVQRLVWEKLAELDAGFFASKRNQFLIKSGLSGVYIVDDVLRFIFSRFSDILSLVFMIPIILFIDWWLFVVLMLAVVIKYWTSSITERHQRRYDLARSRRGDRFYATRTAIEANYYELLSLGSIEVMINKYEEDDKLMNELQIQEMNEENRLRSFERTLTDMLFIGVNVFVGYQVLIGNYTIGTMTLLLSYYNQLYGSFGSVVETKRQFDSLQFNFLKFNHFLQLKTRIIQGSKLISPKDGFTSSSIFVNRITFSYPDYYEDEKQYLQFMLQQLSLKKSNQTHATFQIEAEMEQIHNILEDSNQNKEVLRHVSFQLGKGELVACVGKNGSGKSTLTHVIQHHVEVSEGLVTLYDQPIRDFSQSDVFRQFAWLQQEPFIIDRYSIKENLLLGVNQDNPDLHAKMLELLQTFDILDEITKLPKQLDTILAEDTQLSGGQRQILAITRSLLQNRPFIILDEATSQLDVEKEMRLMRLLQSYKQDHGILFITHRMSVARKADRIYVLDKGEIVQEGNHNSLVNTPGLYADFWQMQTVD